MPINFNDEKNIIIIETQNTLYAMRVLHDKYLIHLYYGKKEGFDPNCEYWWMNFEADCDKWRSLAPESICAEYVGFDSGDCRASALRVKNQCGQSNVFLDYCGHRIFDGRLELDGLPFASADEQTQTLEITLLDPFTNLKVKLYYTVFPQSDVISRYVIYENGGDADLTIEKAMSFTLDLLGCDFDMLSFYGSWDNERNLERYHLRHGLQSLYSRRGMSSHHLNPFFAIAAPDCDENSGLAYGFNLVYSGNFLNEVEVDFLNNTRIQMGLGDEKFSWLLRSGESFTTPEAVMTFTDKGLGQMSRNFHKFIKKHILPPEPFDCRPVVINPWEAVYFDINENMMLQFADKAKKTGMDMLVMDDGWFGARNTDRAGLGDWFPNKEKFPDGLKSFVDKVKANGIKFGIWIEPEMVNPDSDLYRAHPDWCLHCVGRPRLRGRDQLVLDMGREEVIDYLKDTFTKAFDGVALDYFKWDCNRPLSQTGSAALPPERQGEAAHRHILGVYKLQKWFKEKYPNCFLENCAGGGGRYDLGMMKYSSMIWTSDNTIPQKRIQIQYGSLMGYPAATMSCHVSNRKNICEDQKQLKFHGDVAMAGALGYELHLPNASDEMCAGMTEQINRYREYEKLILNGEYYPVYSPFENNYSAYYYMNEKKSEILLSCLQFKPDNGKRVNIPVLYADENAVYFDKVSGKEFKGSDLINGVEFVCDDTDHNSQMWYLKKI